MVSWVISSRSRRERGVRGHAGLIKPWRGRGIAKALLHRAFAEVSTRDRTEVKLGVDALNPHGAVAFYESVGMTVERRLDIFEWGTPDSAAHSEV